MQGSCDMYTRLISLSTVATVVVVGVGEYIAALPKIVCFATELFSRA